MYICYSCYGDSLFLVTHFLHKGLESTGQPAPFGEVAEGT